MKIDEYLMLAYKLRKHVMRCEGKYYNTFTKATGSRDPLDLEGRPSGKGFATNIVELKQINNADAARELSKAYKTYKEYMDMLRTDIYNLYFWEGQLIQQMYIHNPALDRDLWYGVDEILGTKDRHRMRIKADEAQRHLAEIMRARGADIDYSN